MSEIKEIGQKLLFIQSNFCRDKDQLKPLSRKISSSLRGSWMHKLFFRLHVELLVLRKKDKELLHFCMRKCLPEQIDLFLGLPAWRPAAGPLASSASKEIIACFQRNDKALYLSNLRLTSLPPCLTSFFCLRYLDCSNNHLTKLPDLSQSKLTFLDCSYNELTSLPFLGKHLRALNCTSNALSMLPSHLSKCPLQRLSCKYNKLSFLPPFTSYKLKELFCSHNRLSSLPQSLEECPLRKLDCSFNLLKKLPDLSKCPLKELLCQNNHLEALFSFGKCPLKHLNFSYNEVKVWPEECSNSPLQEIIATHNRLESLPLILSTVPLKIRHIWPQKAQVSPISPWIPLKISALHAKTSSPLTKHHWQVSIPSKKEDRFGT